MSDPMDWWTATSMSRFLYRYGITPSRLYSYRINFDIDDLYE